MQKRVATIAVSAGIALCALGLRQAAAGEDVETRIKTEEHHYSVETVPAPPPAVIEKRTTVETLPAPPAVIEKRTTVETVPAPPVVEQRTTVETVPAPPVVEHRTTVTRVPSEPAVIERRTEERIDTND